MISIQPIVRKLSLRPHYTKSWQFKKEIPEEFRDNPAGRIWWVNANTKVMTSLNDNTESEHMPLPPGVRVFHLVGPAIQESALVSELKTLFSEEAQTPTVPCMGRPKKDGSHHALPKRLHMLFTGEISTDRQMTFSETHGVLSVRTPQIAAMITRLSKDISYLLGISQAELEAKANIHLIHYWPNTGFRSHIDNIVRTQGSTGPVFTMSLGGGGVKYMDMLPVIEHWKDPLRISTLVTSVIMIDGESRMEWAHAIPEDDPTERWTITFKFCQVTDNVVKFSETLQMPVHESKLNLND